MSNSLGTRPARILVMDGHTRSALAVVRSLGQREDVEILAASPKRWNMAGASKYCARRLRCPDPEAGDFISWINAAAREHNVDFLMATTDDSLTPLCARRGDLECGDALLPLPEPYFQLSDKLALLETAQKLGLKIPSSFICRSREELESQVRGLQFPAILKPQWSRFIHEGRLVRTKVQPVVIAEDAMRMGAEHLAKGCGVCFQEVIEGEGVGYFALCDRGEVCAEFAHRRLLETRAAGGPSVVCESAQVTDAMRKAGRALLGAADWNGPAMIEFKLDSRTGEPVLMEVNGRYWGSLALPVACGVDFPSLHFDLAVHGRKAEQAAYPLGKRVKWLLGLFARTARDLAGGREAGGVRTKRGGALANFFRLVFTRGDGMVFRFNDPLPALVEWLGLMERRG